ncbi:tRNA(Arg) A34 adenosine deaminase TadA [Arcticibacter pallidicorallinus]|uniref:tRNA(Arg) A34 adenosine deaminase TadA n=1 Tax=Arcticibacter pallidicorallinus TaxID=1259464 RepID=A0A2T0UAZ0_9SPHI|nr:nucleoside deaminase [Arcticibacter pallidicorallinus]PRY55105.1 tRNA(Arg) A34 adenosine deaminase TadA [Arcticibacter pallidicorallinus]
MKDQHLRFMQRAITLAEENIHQCLGGPFGAVIVKDNVIIAESQNLVTSTNDPTAHAEVSAIRKACEKLRTFDLSGCILYTSCEPCPMCLGAVYWSRLSQLFYASTRVDAAAAGFDDDFIYNELALPAGKRQLPTQQILAGEANIVFNLWRDSENKTPY